MADQQMAPQDPRALYHQFVERTTTQVIAAMPVNVPDEGLKRARAKFRVAFSADAQGELQSCTPDSVARAIVLSAMSGLFPGGPRPDVYLIARKNRHRDNVKECNWQISHRGYIRLARKAGWDLEPVLVFAGEKFEVVEGDRPSLTHVRNLETPQTWETVRYAYARVFPIGNREGGKFVYLTKAQIEQRRAKAQTQDIWNEWPLEMCLKTICHYAGNREAFPTDDPARYAIEASERMEISDEGPVRQMVPAGTRTADLARRLGASREGGVIEVEPRPREEQEVGQGAGSAEQPQENALPPGEKLSAPQLKRVMDRAGKANVEIDALEDAFGGRLDQATIPGVNAAELENRMGAEIQRLAGGKP